MLICTIMYAVAPLPAETGGNLGKGASSRVGLPHLFKGSPKVVAIPPADRNCCHAYSGLLGTRRL